MNIKTVITTAILMATATQLFAQRVNVPEPEFVNSYYLLTSDSTYAELPKENGTVKKHTSLGSRIAKVASHAARASRDVTPLLI